MAEDILKKSCVVYLLTNTVNGKKYVGQTLKKLKVRISSHRRNKKSHIGRAINEYGWENFKVEVLAECSSKTELDELEKFWIAELNCKVPNGYNVTNGGKNNSGRCVSLETRMKARLSHPHRRAVRCIDTGEIFLSVNAAAQTFHIGHNSVTNVCKGRQMKAAGKRFEYVDEPLSEEAKHRLPKKTGALKVRCTDTGEIFESIRAAADYFNLRDTSVGQVCKGNMFETGGKHFEYVDSQLKMLADDSRKKLKPRGKVVRCIETGEIFSSARRAGKIKKIYGNTISAVCCGKRKSAGGFHWEYV